jgi:hypothetical protein
MEAAARPRDPRSAILGFGSLGGPAHTLRGARVLPRGPRVRTLTVGRGKGRLIEAGDRCPTRDRWDAESALVLATPWAAARAPWALGRRSPSRWHVPVRPGRYSSRAAAPAEAPSNLGRGTGHAATPGLRPAFAIETAKKWIAASRTNRHGPAWSRRSHSRRRRLAPATAQTKHRQSGRESASSRTSA